MLIDLGIVITALGAWVFTGEALAIRATAERQNTGAVIFLCALGVAVVMVILFVAGS